MVLSYNTTDPSTTDQYLVANTSITLGPIETYQDKKISGFVISDQEGTLYIDQSFDGENWDITTPIEVAATPGLTALSSYYTGGAGQPFKGIAIVAPYMRARYVNGDTDNSVVRLSVMTAY